MTAVEHVTGETLPPVFWEGDLCDRWLRGVIDGGGGPMYR